MYSKQAVSKLTWTNKIWDFSNLEVCQPEEMPQLEGKIISRNLVFSNIGLKCFSWHRMWPSKLTTLRQPSYNGVASTSCSQLITAWLGYISIPMSYQSLCPDHCLGLHICYPGLPTPLKNLINIYYTVTMSQEHSLSTKHHVKYMLCKAQRTMRYGLLSQGV